MLIDVIPIKKRVIPGRSIFFSFKFFCQKNNDDTHYDKYVIPAPSGLLKKENTREKKFTSREVLRIWHRSSIPSNKYENILDRPYVFIAPGNVPENQNFRGILTAIFRYFCHVKSAKFVLKILQIFSG